MAHVSVPALPGRMRLIDPRLLALGGVIILAVVALLTTGALAKVRNLVAILQGSAPSYRTAPVIRGDVVASVSATGSIVAVNDLPLTFKMSGKLAELDVQAGARVARGQKLARLDTSDLQRALDQAKAQLEEAEANLDKVEAGPTSAQRNVAQVAVTSAATAVANARASVETSQRTAARNVVASEGNVRSAQVTLQTAQDALAAAREQEARGLAADRAMVASAEKNLAAARAMAVANGPIRQQNLEKARDSLWAAQVSRDATCGRSRGADCQAANANVAGAETAVNQAQAEIDQGQQQDQQQIAQAQGQLNVARAQLASDQARLAAAVTSAENQVKAAQAALANAQAAVGQAQAQATATVQNARTQADQAEGALRSAQASYDQTVAPPQPADLAAARAQVVNAQAAVDEAQANLDAATLVAPFDGVVAAVNGTVGQEITGGPVNANSSVSPSALIRLIDLSSLQITAQVNEADVGKVKVGDSITFTVDAFPDQTFTGKVLTIQPTGTTSQNVVSYGVTTSIDPVQNAKLYPGMTATITIVTARSHDTLIVPSTALSFPATAIRDGLLGKAVVSGAPAGHQATVVQSTGKDSPTRTAGSVSDAGPGTSRLQQNRSGPGSSGSTDRGQPGLVATLADGKLQLVPVTVGITDGTSTEILSGLRPGDKVVTGVNGASSSATRNASPKPVQFGAPPPEGAIIIQKS